MKYIKKIFIAWVILMVTAAQAQFFNLNPHTDTRKKLPFRGERAKINDLVHTKIKIRLNLREHTANGEAEITLKPHFYPTDSVTLDAKYMEIYEVTVNGQKVDYQYDKKKLKIRLPKTYTRNETYKVYVKYLSQPDSVPVEKSAAIKENRGLYFINTRGETDAYPPQVWTQGEPESNSVWFPTIDSPNQKSTEEIYIENIPEGWLSLSNGKLIQSIQNPDGTHTDYWALDQPHAPYLFFFAVAPFVKVKDSLGQLPINYYVEPQYKDVALDIFGKTPEMIRYFSKLTGVKFPWPKYDQIVVRHFVSGAMENTTAVNHSDMAYNDKDVLIDGNPWEDVIAHELFHHWFGDLVTAESWAQISMNESFADYSESLWEEYDEGKDKADDIRWQKKKMYFMIPGNSKKNLVRYHYRNPDNVFDMVSYQKGGLILHMLRHLVGDEAFFAGMKRYLTENMYETGEAAKLRLAMEATSGKDLTRFFQQWFYGSGSPHLDIQYEFDDQKGKAQVKITQKTEKIWEFPLDIDIYENEKRTRYQVKVKDSIETFEFSYQTRPALINVDADHILLAKINDHRSKETYYYQFFHARNYGDRRLGLDKAVENTEDPKAVKVIISAIDDPFYKLRIKAIENLNVTANYFNRKLEKKLLDKALYDPKTKVSAAAVKKLGETKKKKYIELYERLLHNPSPAIRKAAFEALSKTDPKKITRIVSGLSAAEKEKLAKPLSKFYVENRINEEMPFVAEHLFSNLIESFTDLSNRTNIEKAVDWITTSDNLEANRIYALKIKELGEKYQQYGLKNVAIFMLQKAIKNQKQNQGSNRNEILTFYKETIKALKGK